MKTRRYEKYHYEPLAKTQGAIRLLKLQPGDNMNSNVECEFIAQCMDGDRKPYKYEALSWCWGEGKKDKCIYIRDGHRQSKMNVTSDLFDALKALQRPDRCRYLWINAVCIDQNDLDEKTTRLR